MGAAQEQEAQIRSKAETLGKVETLGKTDVITKGPRVNWQKTMACGLGVLILALAVIALFAVAYLTRSCGEGCGACWDDDNPFFDELFNGDPKCLECTNASMLLAEDGKSCVS